MSAFGQMRNWRVTALASAWAQPPPRDVDTAQTLVYREDTLFPGWFVMITLEAYLRDPCGGASLPFWKENSTQVPKHMRIVHARDFSEVLLLSYTDVPYFKLIHRLEKAAPSVLPEGFFLQTAAMPRDAEALAALLCACYEGSAFTPQHVINFTHSPAYAPELWLTVRDKSGALCGAGLADYDNQAREGVLEWIQVMPSFRGKGIGKAIVNALLAELCPHARFVTVSGQKDDPSDPEALYRACGFSGDDVWHVLTRRHDFQ